jgi:hypothetical protein
MVLPRRVRPLGPDELLARVRGEYTALPGLKLTATHVHRIWALDDEQARQLLERLVQAGFLVDLGDGVFMRRDVAPGPVDEPGEAARA